MDIHLDTAGTDPSPDRHSASPGMDTKRLEEGAGTVGEEVEDERGV